MTAGIVLRQVDRGALVATARGLFREYAQAIGVDLEYQGFSAELAALPVPYLPPDGALLMAQVGADVAGCVALRRLPRGDEAPVRAAGRPRRRPWPSLGQ